MYSHHSSLPESLLTRRTETHQHGLPHKFSCYEHFSKIIRGIKHLKIIKCFLLNLLYLMSINVHIVYLLSSSLLSRSVWKSLRSLISSGASLYCCRSSWITELRRATFFCLSICSFCRSASVMSPSVYGQSRVWDEY